MMPSVTTATGDRGRHFCDPGVQKLLGSLDQLESKADGARPDLLFLKTLLSSPEFSSLMQVHEMVTTPEAKDPPPLYDNALDLTNEVLPDLCGPPEAAELASLLRDPSLTSLLAAHDTIALREFQPALPDVPTEVDEDEEAVKIVRLVKGPQEPLGATIQLDEASRKIKIARVMHGGAADRCGMIHTGDEVTEVNKVKVTGKTPTEVVRILSSSVGPITLKLIPGDLDPNNDRQSKIFMRALFDYDPQEDKYIPCREAGLAFSRGDVLNIVCQDDPNWWQARRVSDSTLRAGLVPGRQLQERKEVLKMTVHGETNNKDTKSKMNGKFSPKLSKKSKKSKKNAAVNQSEELRLSDIQTYEEVHECCPDSAISRTVLLMGPSGVGLSSLQNLLVHSNPEKYKKPVISTSRPKKSSDAHSDTFLYGTRPDMERDIHSKKMFEHWEQKGHLYGTTLASIRAVCEEGRTPVVTCSQPQLLPLVWTSDIRPYVILVSPPEFSTLKSTRSDARAKWSPDDRSPRMFTDDELREMIASADAMATSSAHYISHVLTNELLATAGESLVNVIGRVGAEPQWIPTAWLTGDKGLTEDGDQGLTDETQGATSQAAQGVN